MKKHILITTILASVLIISTIVSADGKGRGAVLVDMIELDPPSPPTPQEEAVGGANLNVNANNTLILNMHINNGAPGVGFDLIVLVQTENNLDPESRIGEKWDSVGDYTFMVLNEQGCGTAQAKVQLDVPEDYTGDSVFVFFHSSSARGTKPGNSWFCYAPRGLFPYPDLQLVEVPLKK